MLRLLAFVLVCVFVCLPNRVVHAAEVTRLAVVVGANRPPPGRATLRYAHEDARHVADVLSAVGGFSATNIKILLDPEPAAVLAALDRNLKAAEQRAGETLLFFYYSGHADDGAIYPGGSSLPFSDLKHRLEDPRAKLRIGLLDSCRGGGWTGTKGLRKVEPFELEASQELAEQGSVLIAASSGHENAHETDALRGSFFTHYWNAGLRGAADRSGDGVVSLHEAFEYARTLTIRDSALAGHPPQHPSFKMRLSGRRDFPLVSLSKQRTTLVFNQRTGPIEVVRLSDGLVVIESTPGMRRLKLGLPSGSYLVRRRGDDAVWSRVVSLSAGGVTNLNETELERSGVRGGGSKDASVFDAQAASWASEHVSASVAAGVRHAPVIDPGLRVGDADGNLVYALRFGARLARHLWLAAPLALAFDAERTGSFNWFGWAGVPTLAVTKPDGASVTLSGFTAFGVDARYRPSERHTFNASVAELGAFSRAKAANQPPSTWTTQVTLGLSETVPGAVIFNLGVAVGANLLVEGHVSEAGLDDVERNVVLAFGSVQRAGLRPLPLIQVPLGDSWSVDAYAVGAYLPSKRGWVETYMAGVSCRD
jgi:hypothetical protein